MYLAFLILAMADTLGSIAVPEVTPSGTFPALRIEYALVEEIPLETITHRFGNTSANLKIEQRYLQGTGARSWQVSLLLTQTQRNTLLSFWQARKGSYQPFTWNKPTDDRTTTEAVTVYFANQPLEQQVAGAARWAVNCTLIEWSNPASAPSYSISSTDTRFPSAGLQTGLLAQVQRVIPLLKIQPKTAGYPALYISDRRCTVGGQLYQARLLRFEGISQAMDGESDQAQFILGNADRVMSALVNDATNGADLKLADVEFAWFHVNTTTKLNSWKGHAVTWSANEGTEFSLQCAEGLHDIHLMYPPDTIERTCWKQREGRFNDGLTCPFATEGALDLVNFPSASGASCDGGNDTPNGCLAHSMERYFGGIVANPRGVSIKDNSQGRWGFGRPKMTATSIVAESVYGEVIPRIFTDATMPVRCKVLAGRDESDFYVALGIVGKGPLGAFGTGHKLDGSFHHGHPGPLGLRTALGTDPAGATDFFSLGQSGNQTGGDFRKVFSGNSTYDNTFAAGIAFLELRRSDEKGIQLSLPADHTMEASVAQGLSGWAWSGAGSRSAVTLSNPVWIAIYALLDLLRLNGASAATAEDYFAVADAVAAAGVCSTSVTKLVGSGSEAQFAYRGIVQERKPFKTWLKEILNCCLGYWTNDFGKISIGLRINASAVESFTEGNVLLGSVQFSPKDFDFNYLSGNFADEEFDYAGNRVGVAFPEHAALYREIRPNDINFAGVFSKSQCARLVTIRAREELGGITPLEWRNAREVTLGTTLLALNVKPGMVCSITHADAPGGVAKFRVKKIVWNGDFSVLIIGDTVTNNMYDLTVGPKPADVEASPVPTEVYAYPRRPAWQPAFRQAHSSDPVLNDHDFLHGVKEDRLAGTVILSGQVPRNRFLAVPATEIRGATYAATGGTLPADRSYFFQVAPYQGAEYGPPSNVGAVFIPVGADTGKITIPSVTWPAPPSGSWDGYRYQLGNTEQSMCLSAAIAGALPASIDITGPFRTFSGALQPNFDRLMGKAKLVLFPGIVRAPVTSVSANTIVCSAFAGGGDLFADHIISVLSDLDDESPRIWNFDVVDYNEATGTFGFLTPNPVAVGVEVGDMVIVRYKLDAFTDTTISEPTWSFTVDELKDTGAIVRIIYGKGRGQYRRVLSNTADVITTEPWNVVPDATSGIIIEEGTWQFFSGSSSFENRTGENFDLTIPCGLEGVVVLTTGIGIDRFNQEAPEDQSPMMELYLHGSGVGGGGEIVIQIAHTTR